MVTVVDTSTVVRYLQNHPDDEALQNRFDREECLHAPALIDAEVASVVRGLMLTTKRKVVLSTERADEMLAAFADLRLERHPMLPYLRRVLELRHNLTVDDAFYVALAETLNMPLLTDDGKYARAAGHRAVIESYP